MSVKITFCRGFLEQIDLTLTNETFQVGSLDYYLPIERKNASEKRAYHLFLATFEKDVSKTNLSRRNCLWYILVVRPI